jgi:hypothetical protein
MKQRDPFDFWFAVNNTEIVLMPRRHLETFGSTMLHYHLVSELMDTVEQVRVREGRMQAHKPQIITPEAYSKVLLEGFGEAAGRYVEWLREHESNIRILQYGYNLKQESFSEHVVSDSIENVIERVKTEVQSKNDPNHAVVRGVEEPWDVCLVKLFRAVIEHSAASNMRDLSRRNMFETADGPSQNVRDEIEAAFVAASRNPALIQPLGVRLQKLGLFETYQDRFFSLFKK